MLTSIQKENNHRVQSKMFSKPSSKEPLKEVKLLRKVWTKYNQKLSKKNFPSLARLEAFCLIVQKEELLLVLRKIKMQLLLFMR